MHQFSDDPAGLLARLERILPQEVLPHLQTVIIESADPMRSLKNFSRWLQTPGSIVERSAILKDHPALLHRLCRLMGASQAIADSLIQNPELALILAETSTLCEPPTREELLTEGRALVKSATSFNHALDRVRYLKQKTILKIAWQDLSSAVEPEATWLALSRLADAVIGLVAEIVQRELGASEIPISIIALGKLGTLELNYSSDIDLLFLSPDESLQEIGTEFGAKIIRAISGRMGRGALYRVDLRLRPLGSSGPLAPTLTSAIRYYQHYAEPWEILSMMRARHIWAQEATAEKLLKEIDPFLYRGPRSEIFLNSLVEVKRRAERIANEKTGINVKTTQGGIRDIEFLVQVLQLLLGHEHPELKSQPTINAIAILERVGALTSREARDLTNAYRLFRQVEHRIQIRYDLQEHVLPKDPAEQTVLARLLRVRGWEQLTSELSRQMTLVRTILTERMPALQQEPPSSQTLAPLLGYEQGTDLARHAERLLHSAPDPPAFVSAVSEMQDVSERARLIVERAPIVISEMAFHKQLWDVAFSEEVELLPEHEEDFKASLQEKLTATSEHGTAIVGEILRREFVLTALKDAFHRNINRTFERLSTLAETVLLHLLRLARGEELDIIALSRLGRRELLLASDWDVILFAPSDVKPRIAEKIGEEFLRLTREVALTCPYLRLDTRLRPEGRHGFLVRTPESLRIYADTRMETWERLALAFGRSLQEWNESKEVLNECVIRKGLAETEKYEILTMRQRTLSERVRYTERTRNIKLGEGTLMDIEWIVAILKLKHRITELPSPTLNATLQSLAKLGLIAPDDAEQLIQHYLFFSRVRNILTLLNLNSDSVIPHEQEKQLRVARSLHLSSAEELLNKLEQAQREVKNILNKAIEEKI
ncbi:MAG: hypothetical protein QXI19_07755 [Candidatus Caldarchaeum sp.]